jgi:hypothetical protein
MMRCNELGRLDSNVLPTDQGADSLARSQILMMQIVSRELVTLGRDTPTLLELVEERCDQVARGMDTGPRRIASLRLRASVGYRPTRHSGRHVP